MGVDAASEGKLIEGVYDCVAREDRIPVLLRDVASAFDAISTVLVYVDPADTNADFALAYGVIADPDVQLRYQRDFATIDPAPATFSSLKLGRAASTDLVFATTMARHKPFIEGFLHPLGLGGTLAGVVANEGGKIGFFALHRGLERRIFDEVDVKSFEIILPHVVKMLSLRRAFFQMETLKAALDAALDPLMTAVMSLDHKSSLVYANALSRTILGRGDGLYLDRFGRLLAIDRAANEALAGLRTRGATDSVIRVPRTESFIPYILRVRPEPELRAGCPAPHVTIYVSDAAPALDVNHEELASALGLTPAGAKLVVALLRGETLDVFAERAGISRHTAKFHLRSAFAATGTRRQSDLLRIAGRVAGDLML